MAVLPCSRPKLICALGHLPSLAAAREVVRNSFEVTTFKPKSAKDWTAAYARLEKLVKKLGRCAGRIILNQTVKQCLSVVTTNPFPKWLPEVAEDEIVITPDNITVECRANMWTFSLTGEQAVATTPADVETFVLEVVAARRRQVATLAKGSMLFYCWHDELAAQLRFSMVMSCHGKLPFGGPVERVADLGEIIRPFLNSKYHDGIPWSEVTDTTSLSDAEREQLEQEHERRRETSRLKVWVQEIPSHGPLAAQPYTDIAELDPLAQSAKELKRLLLTSDDVVAFAAVRSEVWLAVLEKYPFMGRCVARNKAVPIKILEALASHPDRQVRTDVAEKRRTPESVMLKLADDSDESVRHTVACNAKATRAVLEKLANDASSWVRERARERLASMMNSPVP